jgi:hypothetical protein
MPYSKSQLRKCGARKLFAGGTFTLNKIWAQDKIYILVGLLYDMPYVSLKCVLT